MLIYSTEYKLIENITATIAIEFQMFAIFKDIVHVVWILMRGVSLGAFSYLHT